jgi:hypothetical protein
VALDPFGLQHTIDPETVQTGLLDDDNREIPPGPRSRFLLELSEPFEQASDIAALNRMLRHLLPAPRRQRRDQPSRSAQFQRNEDCAKIRSDSGRRLGSVSYNFIVVSRVDGFSNLTLAERRSLS